MALKEDKREKVQKELVSSYKTGTSGIFVLAPRFGKTRLGINIIKKEKCKSVLWVTPSSELRDVDIPNEFIKWKAKTYLSKTKIITYKMLHKEVGEYDLIVLDEPQDITDFNSITLLDGSLKANGIIGLTGTLPEHEEKLTIFKKLGLSIFKEITIDEAVDDGILADYQVNVVECNLNAKDKNVEAGKKGSKFKTTEYQNYNYVTGIVNKAMFSNNPGFKKIAIINRMRAIYNSPTKDEMGIKLFNSDKLKGRKLIFCSSIDQAEKMCKYTYHSKTNDKHLKMFLEGKIDKLACVNAGGVGFTYENVDHFIIIQANSNKKGDITQKMSRSLLKQKDYKANIWILSLLGTQDEEWVSKALKNFNDDKIKFIHSKNLKL